MSEGGRRGREWWRAIDMMQGKRNLKSQNTPAGLQECGQREGAVWRWREEQVIPAPSYHPQITQQGAAQRFTTFNNSFVICLNNSAVFSHLEWRMSSSGQTIISFYYQIQRRNVWAVTLQSRIKCATPLVNLQTTSPAEDQLIGSDLILISILSI